MYHIKFILVLVYYMMIMMVFINGMIMLILNGFGKNFGYSVSKFISLLKVFFFF